jgi:hypothetical protein
MQRNDRRAQTSAQKFLLLRIGRGRHLIHTCFHESMGVCTGPQTEIAIPMRLNLFMQGARIASRLAMQWCSITSQRSAETARSNNNQKPLDCAAALEAIDLGWSGRAHQLGPSAADPHAQRPICESPTIIGDGQRFHSAQTSRLRMTSIAGVQRLSYTNRGSPNSRYR